LNKGHENTFLKNYKYFVAETYRAFNVAVYTFLLDISS